MKASLVMAIFVSSLTSASLLGQPAQEKGQLAHPVQPGKVKANLTGHEKGVTFLSFSPDGKLLHSADPQGVRVWDLATGKEVRAMLALPGRVVALSRDGKSAALTDRAEVAIFEMAMGKERLSFDPHGELPAHFPFPPRMAAMAFGPDGTKLATASSAARVGGPHGYPGGVVAIWDAKTGHALHRFDTLSTGPSSVAFSTDGQFVAAGTNGAGGELPEPGQILVWNAQTGKVVHTFKAKLEVEPGEQSSVTEVAFSPEGKWIAATMSAGSRGRPAGQLVDEAPSTLRIWEMASGKEVMTLQASQYALGCLAFSPDGKWVAVGGNDPAVRLWNLSRPKELQSIPLKTLPVGAIAFSPDGHQLAIGLGAADKPGDIQIWSLDLD